LLAATRPLYLALPKSALHLCEQFVIRASHIDRLREPRGSGRRLMRQRIGEPLQLADLSFLSFKTSLPVVDPGHPRRHRANLVDERFEPETQLGVEALLSRKSV
jgi:hypothetical protein